MIYRKDSTTRRRRLFTGVMLLTVCIVAWGASAHSSSDAAVFSARASLPETVEAVPPDTSSQGSFGQTVPQPAFIYLVGADGRLMWYRHNGANSGAGLETPGAWAGGAKAVGRGWGGFKHVFSPGRGIIYGVAPDGILKWYRHNGFASGAGLEAAWAWTGPKDVGRGWGEATYVFALMPSDPAPIH